MLFIFSAFSVSTCWKPTQHRRFQEDKLLGLIMTDTGKSEINERGRIVKIFIIKSLT